MKYIIVSDNGLLSHKNVAGKGTVISAGFCSISYDYSSKELRVSAYGESVTLNISSRKEDSEIIFRSLEL
jgi:hypothetical protein